MDNVLPADPHTEIRQEVAKLCAKFPGEYWRKLDQERAYPTEFVRALTEGGYLAALIPEEYGGAGLSLSAAAAILETVQAEGCNGAACHAQMYIMGTILREDAVSAEDRDGRTPLAGVRRHRTDQRDRHDLAADLRP
jgi:acyl-CoA dehydrogenase